MGAYELTATDIKKATQNATYAARRRERAESTAAAAQAAGPKARRSAGFKRGRATMDEYKGDVDYYRGLGQARLDRAAGVNYAAKGSSKSFNTGYYRGWNQPK